MKPETIKELLDQGTTSDQLVEILHQDKHIRETKEHLQIQIQKEIERHRNTIKELNAAIHQNKINCPHHETTYYPDPSGNNDSYHICTACGKEAKNLKKQS